MISLWDASVVKIVAIITVQWLKFWEKLQYQSARHKISHTIMRSQGKCEKNDCGKYFKSNAIILQLWKSKIKALIGQTDKFRIDNAANNWRDLDSNPAAQMD